MDIMDIMCKRLNVALIRNNYIIGMKYSYEEYLVDFLNASKLKKDKGNIEFKHVKAQANSEADTTNGLYELDFKLFVDRKHMEAIRNLSMGIVRKGGITLYTASKKEGEMEFCNIIKLIRNKKKNFFENAINDASNQYQALKDIIKNIEVEKNILLFLPYELYCNEHTTDEKIAEFIAECISNDLKELVAYRNEKVQRDTYIGFISQNKFIIIKDNNKCLKYYDMVDVNKSKLYCELCDVLWQY